MDIRDAQEICSSRNPGPELERKSGPVPVGIRKEAGQEPEFWLKSRKKRISETLQKA